MKTWLSIRLVVCLLLCVNLTTYAQQGFLDTDFGNNGFMSSTFPGGSFVVSDMVLQSDDKVLCFGKYYVTTSSSYFPAVIRFMANGSSIDLSFGNNGVKVLSDQVYLADVTYKMALGPQDKIYLASMIQSDLKVYRLNADGSTDTTFSNDGVTVLDIPGAGESLANLTVQADGKLLVAATHGNDFGVARYNTDGTLDSGFGNSGAVSKSLNGADQVYNIAVQGDGKILVCGTTDDGFGSMLAVLRLNSNGSVDNTFANNGWVSRIVTGNDFAYAVQSTSTGRVLLAGRSATGTLFQDGVIAAYTSSGEVDSTFASVGLAVMQLQFIVDYFHDLVVQSDDKVIATGIHQVNGEDAVFLISRFNTDGTLDTGFGTNGSNTAAVSGVDLQAFAIALDSNGDAVIAGTHQSDDAVRVAKFIATDPVSVPNINTKSTFYVYPNPANDQLYIKTNAAVDGKVTLSIYDLSGRQIIEHLFIDGGYDRYSLSVSELQAGSYIGVIRNGLHNSSFSFVKQ